VDFHGFWWVGIQDIADRVFKEARTTIPPGKACEGSVSSANRRNAHAARSSTG
jgi:hypothetical protein